jgi:hypothetical protein
MKGRSSHFNKQKPNCVESHLLDNNDSNLKVSYPSRFTNDRGKARRMDVEEVRNFWIEEKLNAVKKKMKRKWTAQIISQVPHIF